jgi:hypothetical protein
MGRVLAVNIAVRAEDGSVRTFAAGSSVPSWVAEQIDNDAVWALAPEVVEVEAPAVLEPVEPDPLGDGGGGDPTVGDQGDASTSDDPAADVTPPQEQLPLPPPKVGPKATRDAWAAYAESAGFEVEAGDGRDEIIAELEAQGVPTEAAAPAES